MPTIYFENELAECTFKFAHTLLTRIYTHKAGTLTVFKKERQVHSQLSIVSANKFIKCYYYKRPKIKSFSRSDNLYSVHTSNVSLQTLQTLFLN